MCMNTYLHRQRFSGVFLSKNEILKRPVRVFSSDRGVFVLWDQQNY